VQRRLVLVLVLLVLVLVVWRSSHFIARVLRAA
jgi:hypothetical protein